MDRVEDHRGGRRLKGKEMDNHPGPLGRGGQGKVMREGGGGDGFENVEQFEDPHQTEGGVKRLGFMGWGSEEEGEGCRGLESEVTPSRGRHPVIKMSSPGQGGGEQARDNPRPVVSGGFLGDLPEMGEAHAE